MDAISIFDCDSPAFTSIVDSAQWRLGIINYSPNIDLKSLKKRERHLLSDELFIPVIGQSWLLIGTQMKQYPLEIGKAYLIEKGIWHAFATSTDGKTFVVENVGTSVDNSEYFFFD